MRLPISYRNPNLRVRADLHRKASLYYMNELYQGVCREAIARWAREHGYEFEQVRLQQGITSEVEIVGRFNDETRGTVYVDLWWTDETRTNVECELSYFGNGPDGVRAHMPGARQVINTREG